MIVETSSHVSSYRLPSQLSGISLNCVAGMGLPFLQSIQEMQKYTLTILVHGLWDLRQKHVTALDRRLTFASAICKSQRFPSRIQFLQPFVGTSTMCMLIEYGFQRICLIFL
jgi:hypothetical protein